MVKEKQQSNSGSRDSFCRAAKSDPQFAAIKRVDAIPGVGEVTATAVVSRIASKGFKSADSFVAYCGLDVRVNESGKRKGKTTISKQGDAELRRLLYCCAQATTRCKVSPFKDQYKQMRDRGMPTTKALCAIARKMAMVCWSIAHYNTDYQHDRVHTGASQLAKPIESN